MPLLQNISNLYYYSVSIQSKEFVMLIDTHTLQRMFTSIQFGRPVGHVDGNMIQHESFFNGHETRWSLRCISPTLGGKLQWQVWMITGRKPTAEDLKLTCKNRSFDSTMLAEHGDLWFFDPNKVISLSPLIHQVSPQPGYGGMQIGGMMPQQMFNQPGFMGPGTLPQHPHLNFPWNQPRMDQVGAARSGTFTYDPKMVAKQLRGSLLTADGMIELNRLTQSLNRELVTPIKWVINEDNTDVVNTFYGDPIFASAADRIIAFKVLLDIPVSQGFIIVTSDIEAFTITVRLP